MDWLILTVLVALIGSFLGAAWYVGRRIDAQRPLEGPRVEAPWVAVGKEVDELRKRVEGFQASVTELAELVDYLPKKWEDINLKARSFYDRATYAVRRTRKELAALELGDEALDDLDEDIHELHGKRGEDDGVPEVQEAVGGAAEEDPNAKSFIYKMMRAR